MGTKRATFGGRGKNAFKAQKGNGGVCLHLQNTKTPPQAFVPADIGIGSFVPKQRYCPKVGTKRPTSGGRGNNAFEA